MTAPTSIDVTPFDVCGPLPTGVTLLEASAGTGKTFTIAALVARYVADGLPLDALLVVTFTRMATGELRERVRERLLTAEHGLSEALAGVAPPDDDAVLRLLADAEPDELTRRRDRLAAALADFDAATITTTHGFCQHILAGLGVAGDVERDPTLVEDVPDLVDEVVDDLFVRKWHGDASGPRLEAAEARHIVRTAVAQALAHLEPADAPSGSEPALRYSLALNARNEVDRRKRRAGLLTYDDLLSRLRDTLADPETGAAACDRLRRRYRVALIDEFQDTDPVQWEIVHRAFAGEPDRGGHAATLVLIGDPKQAIYGFRGADVFAYLEARRSARGGVRTLGVNQRSDQPLIDAYDALLRGTQLGVAGIDYLQVRAAPANETAGLTGAPAPAPLRVRMLHRTDELVPLTPTGLAKAADARAVVARDLADDVVALLESGAAVRSRRGDPEPVRPGHIAVLVRTNRAAELVRETLTAAGVPAVLAGAGSVVTSDAARQWLQLLEALERPSHPGRAHAVALSAFVGWSARQVATAGEDAWESVHARLHRWAAVLRDSGVAALLDGITRTERLPERLLAAVDGERVLTDLRHVGQLLHAEARAGHGGVTALATWLRERTADAADAGPGADERTRRLESDAEAVQVLTIHRSKGLEFPIVYLPDLSEPSYIPRQPIPIFHDEVHRRRTIDVGNGGTWFPPRKRAHVAEQRGEDLRLMYVALTRARHQAVLWWAGAKDAGDSPLGRLLFARGEGGAVAPALGYVPPDDDVAARLADLATSAPGRIAVERVPAPVGRRWAPIASAPLALEVRSFARTLDDTWRRTSYSAITAAAHEQPRTGGSSWVASEPEEPALADEPALALALPPDIGSAMGDQMSAGARTRGEGELRGIPLPLADVPGGAAVGTLVHAVIEHTDLAADDLAEALSASLRQQRRYRGVDIGDADGLVRGLALALSTPLGPLVGDRALRGVPRGDRLDELAFEYPLAGGDAARGRTAAAAATLDDVATLLEAHLRPGDPLEGYADRLRDPLLAADLRGYLSGSVDLVLRARTDGDTTFTVVDHKTNWLVPDGEEPSAWHYRPEALAAAMQRAHYPLQALLYCVALHRYLRWRLAGYEPSAHLGGVLYLFLRGMVGPDAPRVDGHPCGVFAWRPPEGLVPALSDLLDRGAAGAA